MKTVIVRTILVIVCMLALNIGKVSAQCAMCRASLESNLSNGTDTIGAGLNTGILYLLVMPYLAIGLIAFFWYRNSRKHYAYLANKSHIVRKVSAMQTGRSFHA
jgi:hypothetical protein